MPPTVNVTTTTNQYLAPKWVDQILRDNLFFAKVLEKTERFRGSQMLFPIKYQKGVASVAFSGFDLLPITQQTVSVNATFYPSFVATNVALAGDQLSVNRAEGNGSLKVLDLMETMMESRAQDAADDIGTYFQGAGTADGGKAPMGLTGIVDDGTTLATYGGLTRSTYTNMKATVTASSGTITLLKVRTLNNNISDGPVAPDLAITDYTTWAYLEQLMTPFQRNNYSSYKDMEFGSGVTNPMAGLYWGGLVNFRDKKITTGYYYQLNTEFLKFYSLNWWQGTSVSPRAKNVEGNVYDAKRYAPSSAFTWTGWVNAFNQGAVNGWMILGGQLISKAPFRQGVLTGITSAG